ncbi:MAG TPA: cytochrome P450 [Nocardioides sp.]|uniref:cytochrome P450 n=1 Tax=uncultured Nocardioides sp. TaxID=198441 RepID=UPI000EE9E28A|nr:cytochrome P450 [uncultured Nocardioides sp.]HCB06223.1 cytochrome P450 [Nocardioides sp.]HRD59616.1 cytochrome P450 [Nocardioides sp.]HRI94237.1 cytochrome P450 [Nocardioides sp.]HRK44310.1 cytochrome P450 [Nocardioides sp.]
MTASAGVGRDDWEREATRRTGAGAVFDPYPRYAELRTLGPVLPGSIPSHFGLPDPVHHVFGDRPHFATFDWRTTERVLKDADTFGNGGLAPMNVRQFGPVSLQSSDGVEHRRYRMLMQPAFARRGLAMWERWLVGRLDSLIDEFEAAGHADLYYAYCAPFPAYVTAMAFGVPAADVELFSRWAAMLQIGASTPEGADEASRNVVDYMSGIIAERRREPQDDLISLLVNSELPGEEGGGTASDEQILGLVRNLMPAGVGTTFRTLGIVLITLFERPELLARVKVEPELVPRVIDEVLRWNPPLAWMLRMTTRDTVLEGVEIPAGAIVHAGIAAANRDPAVVSDPDEMNPDRPDLQHLSFSAGPHFCVGMQVSRLELETALSTLLRRLPGLVPDPDADRPEVTGLMFRMPTGAPARWA